MTKATLHNADNFSFVPSDSIDFLLTDPPFNISKVTNFHTYEKNTIHSYKFDAEEAESWDTYTHDEFLLKLDEWSSEFARVLKKGGNFAIFCADSYISHLMEALKKHGLSPRRVISWRKPNAVPINRAYMPSSAIEYVIVGVKGGKAAFNADVTIENQTLDQKIIESTIVADKASNVVFSIIKKNLLLADFDGLDDVQHYDQIGNVVNASIEAIKAEVVKKVRDMYKTNAEGKLYLQACIPNYLQSPLKTGKRIHPTEKPVAILQYFIALYSKAGDTILDPFGGSGSTGEAALELGRNVILVERDKVFFEKLSNRIEPLNTTDSE